MITCHICKKEGMASSGTSFILNLAGICYDIVIEQGATICVDCNNAIRSALSKTVQELTKKLTEE